MTKFTEGRHAGEGLMSEDELSYSRDAIVIASGSGVLKVGTVLGKITASGKYKASPATGSDGSQVAVAVLLYEVDATSADVPVTAITREAIWNKNTLSFDPSVNDAAKIAAKIDQLKAVTILAR